MFKVDFLIGSLAGLLCTISFLPQVIKAAKTRQTKDLSLAAFLILCAGVLLWLVYGVLIKQLPIILSNATIFLLLLLILAMKIKYR